MCPGYHYSWECGKQPSHGPVFVDYFKSGWLIKKPDGKVIGYGDKFFYYQMLTGDTVDNIPGLPKWGTVKAFKTLDTNFTSKRDMYELVSGLYKEAMGEEWLSYFKEQANLLWMVRQLDSDGNPVMFKPPKKEEQDET
jgi:5'-3' exonuclease